MRIKRIPRRCDSYRNLIIIMCVLKWRIPKAKAFVFWLWFVLYFTKSDFIVIINAIANSFIAITSHFNSMSILNVVSPLKWNSLNWMIGLNECHYESDSIHSWFLYFICDFVIYSFVNQPIQCLTSDEGD